MFYQHKKKALASASVFFNEAHLRRMKNDAGLCPMKCGFATCGRGGALRFMFAKQTHHTSFASASYRRSRCFVKCSKPLISRTFHVFGGKNPPFSPLHLFPDLLDLDWRFYANILILYSFCDIILKTKKCSDYIENSRYNRAFKKALEAIFFGIVCYDISNV